jgi:hypothetical protein
MTVNIPTLRKSKTFDGFQRFPSPGFERPIQFYWWYTGSFKTRAPEEMRKHEIAFGCVILKEKHIA